MSQERVSIPNQVSSHTPVVQKVSLAILTVNVYGCVYVHVWGVPAEHLFHAS